MIIKYILYTQVFLTYSLLKRKSISNWKYAQRKLDEQYKIIIAKTLKKKKIENV